MVFWVYVKAIGKHWWALMSCAAFTFLGLYIAWANKNTGWTVRGIFGLALALLFVASFLAWLDEHQKRILLEKSLEPIPNLKKQLVQLSQSILDFVYERANDAPEMPVSTLQPYGNEFNAYLAEMQKSNQQFAAIRTYEQETLEIYEYKYKSAVTEAIVSVKNVGVDSSELDETVKDLYGEFDPDHPRLVIPSGMCIKQIGKQLGILADQIKES